MALIKPAWQSKNITKAKEAVRKIVDQDLLYEIANNNDIESEIRGLAAGKIDRSDLIEKLLISTRAFFLNNPSCSLRGKYENRKQEQIALWNANAYEGNKQVIIAAISKVVDQNVLSEIVVNSLPHIFIIKEAAKNISDPQIISETVITLITNYCAKQLNSLPDVRTPIGQLMNSRDLLFVIDELEKVYRQSASVYDDRTSSYKNTIRY